MRQLLGFHSNVRFDHANKKYRSETLGICITSCNANIIVAVLSGVSIKDDNLGQPLTTLHFGPQLFTTPPSIN